MFITDRANLFSDLGARLRDISSAAGPIASCRCRWVGKGFDHPSAARCVSFTGRTRLAFSPFANARATRIKLLVHDGFGVWCAARRLNAGHFAWPREAAATPLSLTQAQFDALVVGLPWQRLPEMSVITRM